MIVKEIDIKYTRDGKLKEYLSKYEIECDICHKHYISKLSNRKKMLLKNEKDLCSSCRQRLEYKLGKRENQREKVKRLSEWQTGKTFEEMYGIEKAQKLKQNLSCVFSGKNNPMYGKSYQCTGFREHSKKLKNKTYEEVYGEEKARVIKKKLSQPGENNPMYGKPSPEGSGNGWSGWYNGHYFRSLLELSYMHKLDALNIRYVTAETKEFEVEYLDWKNNKRIYFPDLYLPLTNEVIEIKPKKLVNTNNNQLKYKEAMKKFSNFKIITDEEIEKLSYKKIVDLINRGILKFIKRYNNKLKEWRNTNEEVV